MLHQSISSADVAAAAWPSALEGYVLTAPAGDTIVEQAAQERQSGPTAAAPDVAAGVGGLIVGSYACLVLVFFAFFTGSLLATLVVTVAAGFVAIFFAIPRIFFAIEPSAGRRPAMSEFMYRGIDTLTGHSSGRDALVQMLIVPVLLTLGVLAMGIVGAVYL